MIRCEGLGDGRISLRRHAVQSPPHGLQDHIEALHRDGIVIIPDFLGADVLERMRAALPDPSEFQESPEGDRSLFYPDAHLVPGLGPFFDSPTVSMVAKSYISSRVIPLRRTVGLKVVHGDITCFEVFPHIDTWKKRLKAFLYLEDVTADNGPMRYLRGSHRGAWRLPSEARIDAWYRTDDRGFALPEHYYLGCVWPHEAGRLSAAFGYEDVECTGTAGTLVMFDGRGVHRATPLRAGRRTILTSYWVHAGDHT
ncbi:phytanoyl-CoA dioxygenase family protein [Streptomyces sp. SAI-229]|uniref:phytanoyl-CoA dioxygenase family protein n=1 Tax=Streptomyces sp. SAI-229 TaxID=3377731 RepID=UPI003C7E6B53